VNDVLIAFRSSLGVIFGYVLGDIGEHLLEKVWSIFFWLDDQEWGYDLGLSCWMKLAN
jgi:hypothetical protein